jgi:hypothetical protein
MEHDSPEKAVSLLDTGLSSIFSSEVLDKEELRRLKALSGELRHSVDTRTIFRTTTEALFSVLNDVKHPTSASKFHQAKLEQVVMFDNLLRLSFEYRLKVIDYHEIVYKLNSAEGFERERLFVERDKALYTLDAMRREARERLRELEMWSDIKVALDNESFDIDSKDTDELISLTLRYCQELPVAMRSKMDVGGAVNIIAQATTLLNECERRGVKLSPEMNRAKKMLKRV